MNINTRTYDDFVEVMSKFRDIIGRNSFRDMSIEDLEYLFDNVVDVADEWKHLDSDIKEWLGILDEVEEK